MTQLVIEKESFNTKDFVLPYSILHGYGERSALFEEGDVGLDKVVNVSVQLGPRGEGRQEVLRILYMSPSIKHLLSLPAAESGGQSAEQHSAQNFQSLRPSLLQC